ncbi:MAG TPA: hypothetical protein VKP65_25820 [Rhodothermales bacterium]|nr:hypothetical protein [Rhodothermales bacterium]
MGLENWEIEKRTSGGTEDGAKEPVSSPFPLSASLFPVFLAFLLAACNPFAPDLREGDPFGSLLGDQTTVEGFFTNFRNAYELRDLSLYEPLLDSSFVFEYFDFDAGIDREWGFSQELTSTSRLFQNAGLIQLQWNQILSQQVLDAGRQSQVVRSFNLTISLEGGEVFRTDGNVNFLLVRPDTMAVWRLRRWRDESEL